MRKQALAAIVVFAQCVLQGQIREGSERGMYPTGSYTVSEVETVNNVNGNLFLSIPIVQMPPGRSAYAGPVRLNYNAALFDVVSETPQYQQGFRKVLSVSEEGGWSYGFDYGLRVVTRPDLSGSTNCGVSENVNTHKYQLLMPDGGKKELTLMGQAQADTVDGYYRVSSTGLYFHCPFYTPLSGYTVGTMIFYTTDGSFLRLALPYNNAQNFADQTWTLYLPDGGKVEGKSDYTTRVTDPKGWSVSYSRTFGAQNVTTSFTIAEEQPPFRTITTSTPSTPTSPSTDTFTWAGFGASLSTTVTWGIINAGSHSYQCESAGPLCQLADREPS